MAAGIPLFHDYLKISDFSLYGMEILQIMCQKFQHLWNIYCVLT